MLKLALPAVAALLLGTAAGAQTMTTTTKTTVNRNGTHVTERTVTRTSKPYRTDRGWHAGKRHCKTWWYGGKKMKSCKVRRR